MVWADASDRHGLPSTQDAVVRPEGTTRSCKHLDLWPASDRQSRHHCRFFLGCGQKELTRPSTECRRMILGAGRVSSSPAPTSRFSPLNRRYLGPQVQVAPTLRECRSCVYVERCGILQAAKGCPASLLRDPPIRHLSRTRQGKDRADAFKSFLRLSD